MALNGYGKRPPNRLFTPTPPLPETFAPARTSALSGRLLLHPMLLLQQEQRHEQQHDEQAAIARLKKARLERRRAKEAARSARRRRAAGAKGLADEAQRSAARRAAAGAEGRSKEARRSRKRRRAAGAEERAKEAQRLAALPKKRCSHNRREHYCSDCGGKGMCPHGKRLPKGRKDCDHCPHGKLDSSIYQRCPDCKREGLCQPHHKPNCEVCREKWMPARELKMILASMPRKYHATVGARSLFSGSCWGSGCGQEVLPRILRPVPPSACKSPQEHTI